MNCVPHLAGKLGRDAFHRVRPVGRSGIRLYQGCMFTGVSAPQGEGKPDNKLTIAEPAVSVQNGPVSESPPVNQEVVDAEHLKVLSIAHYVYGGLQALLSCILIFHFGLGLFMAIAPRAFGEGHGQAPPVWVGLLMSAVAGCLMLIGWLIGGLTIYSGVCLKRRRNRVFSFVMAIVNCLSFPFGTALGVFTLIVLSRSSVVRLYEESAARPLV